MDANPNHASSAPPPDPVTVEQALLLRFFHDLNNHLGIVMGNAELLLDGGPNGGMSGGTNEEKRARRTQAIHTSATEAAALVLEMQKRLGDT